MTDVPHIIEVPIDPDIMIDTNTGRYPNVRNLLFELIDRVPRNVYLKKLLRVYMLLESFRHPVKYNSQGGIVSDNFRTAPLIVEDLINDIGGFVLAVHHDLTLPYGGPDSRRLRNLIPTINDLINRYYDVLYELGINPSINYFIK